MIQEHKGKLPRTGNGLVCLNAGCGRHFRTDWVNLDFQATPHVQACDLRQQLPFPENTFDAVYSSHVLEHFDTHQARYFIGELKRVLKTGGIIRLATPDLERMVREYLQNLKAWDKERSQSNRRRYEWILMEMFDQMTRVRSGGLMLEKIHAGDVEPSYVVTRTGDELKTLLFPLPATNLPPIKPHPPTFFKKLERQYKRMLRMLRSKPVREQSAADTGELHRWYYDRLSLEFLLTQAGFGAYAVVEYNVSKISGWSTMNLDANQEGDGMRKPDSIIVEAVKS
jgi:predicted SAM-dependent methyltransferase